MKKTILLFTFLFLYSCGGGGSSSTQSIPLNVESITPANNSTLEFGAINYDSFLDISAQVSGGVTSVECFVDGQSYGKKYSPPYSWEINILDSYLNQGAHSIRIDAQDSEGNMATRSSVVNTENYFFVEVHSLCVTVSTGFYWRFTPVTQGLNVFYNFFYGETANIGSDGGSDTILQEGTYRLQIIEIDTGQTIGDLNIDINPQSVGDNWYASFRLGISGNQYTLDID
jgi:hypothetical protein